MKSKNFSFAIVALLLCVVVTVAYADHRSIFEVLAKAAIPEGSNNRVTVFKTAVEDAGLDKMLNAGSPDVDIPALKPPHTVFVPTDDAFSKLTAAQQAELESDLRTIIRSHIILQSSLSIEDLVSQGTIPSMSGEPITVKLSDDGRVVINDIAVIIHSMEVDRSEGVRDDLPEVLGFIHVIDTLLLDEDIASAGEINTSTFLPMIMHSNPSSVSQIDSSRITNMNVVAECVCPNGVSVTDDSCAPEDAGVIVEIDVQYRGPTVDRLYLSIDLGDAYSSFVPVPFTGSMFTDASGTRAEGSNWELWVGPYWGYSSQQDEVTSSQLDFEFYGFVASEQVTMSAQESAFTTFTYNRRWTEQSCTP